MLKRWILIALLLALALTPASQAQGPDYSIPAQFALPWECGQGYQVTWDPEGHWEEGKATGLAYDFSMPEGTLIKAPMSGMAHYAQDTRPLETNLGNYIEIVDESGQWMVRLAHLRDAQQGSRWVQVGEPIGYSGASGVSRPHLHLEILVRQGERWGRPDRDRLQMLFGLPAQAFAIGAWITNLGCPAQLALAGDILPSQSPLPLGESVALRVPLYNNGLEDLHLTLLQVSLFSLDGQAVLAEAEGDWQIAGKTSLEIPLPAQMPAPGTWYVGRLTYRTDQGMNSLPARGQLQVAPSPLQLLGIASPRSALKIGEQVSLYLWVANRSAQDFAPEAIVISGKRPDGVPWRVATQEPVVLAAGQIQRIAFAPALRIDQVGDWTVERVGYYRSGKEQTIGQMARTIRVSGPQLAIESLEWTRSGQMVHTFLRLVNIGTEQATPEAIELWGWKPNDEPFGQRLQGVAPLEAGQTTLIQIDVPLDDTAGAWRLVEIGYWDDGSFYRMALPTEPTLMLLKPSPQPLSIGSSRFLPY